MSSHGRTSVISLSAILIFSSQRMNLVWVTRFPKHEALRGLLHSHVLRLIQQQPFSLSVILVAFLYACSAYWDEIGKWETSLSLDMVSC